MDASPMVEMASDGPDSETPHQTALRREQEALRFCGIATFAFLASFGIGISLLSSERRYGDITFIVLLSFLCGSLAILVAQVMHQRRRIPAVSHVAAHTGAPGRSLIGSKALACCGIASFVFLVSFGIGITMLPAPRGEREAPLSVQMLCLLCIVLAALAISLTHRRLRPAPVVARTAAPRAPEASAAERPVRSSAAAHAGPVAPARSPSRAGSKGLVLWGIAIGLLFLAYDIGMVLAVLIGGSESAQSWAPISLPLAASLISAPLLLIALVLGLKGLVTDRGTRGRAFSAVMLAGLFLVPAAYGFVGTVAIEYSSIAHGTLPLTWVAHVFDFPPSES